MSSGSWLTEGQLKLIDLYPLTVRKCGPPGIQAADLVMADAESAVEPVNDDDNDFVFGAQIPVLKGEVFRVNNPHCSDTNSC